MSDPNKVDMSWREPQEIMYGHIDRRLSPKNPMCVRCGKGVVFTSELVWIDLGDGGTAMPKVAIHEDCCNGLGHAEIVKLALEALPAAITGRHTKPHPVMPRLWGSRH